MIRQCIILCMFCLNIHLIRGQNDLKAINLEYYEEQFKKVRTEEHRVFREIQQVIFSDSITRTSCTGMIRILIENRNQEILKFLLLNIHRRTDGNIFEREKLVYTKLQAIDSYEIWSVLDKTNLIEELELVQPDFKLDDDNFDLILKLIGPERSDLLQDKYQKADTQKTKEKWKLLLKKYKIIYREGVD